MGPFGSCYEFSNTNNGINIPNKNFSDLFDFTMSAWICPLGTHLHYDGAIISSGNWNTIHWAFSISQNNTAIVLRKPNINIPYSFSLNTWYHVLYRRNANTITVFVNGIQIYTGLITANIPLSSDASNTMIGRETYEADILLLMVVYPM